MPAKTRKRRLVIYLSDEEHRIIRIKAAEDDTSQAELGRRLLLGYAAGEVAFHPRLPGFDDMRNER